MYVRYHYFDKWDEAKCVDEYILRASLAAAFSGQPDNLLDAITARLVALKSFDLDELFGLMRAQGRSLELTEDRLW